MFNVVRKMKKQDLIVKKDRLNKENTIDKTYGCRHSNPEICSNNGIPDMCAFCSKDNICKKPPRLWKRMYEELKLKEEQ